MRVGEHGKEEVDDTGREGGMLSKDGQQEVERG